MSGDRNFWSRRKANVAAEAEAEAAALDAQALAETQLQLDEKTDAELLEEFDLPDPDTLKMGDDFTAFMSKAVPDRLRRRALRTLWRSNPVLANVDMLVDYGEDFTDSATVVENMQTAYQVGKGMLKHVEEMARQAAELESPPEPDPTDEMEEDLEIELAEVEIDETPEPATMVEFEDDDLDPIIEAPLPRRMKFRTPENAA